MQQKLIVFFLFASLSSLSAALGKAASSEESSGKAASTIRPRIEIPLEVPEAARARPGFDVDEATEAYVEFLSDEQRAKSDAYTNGGHWLILWNFLFGLGVAAVLLFGGFSAKMRDLSERISKRRPVQTALYGVQYILVTTLVGLPLAFYQGFVREHQYEMATQTAGLWLGDQAKGLMVGIVFWSLLLVAIYGAIRRAPKSWWIWGSAISVVFLLFFVMIFPVFVAPLFNEFKPLEEGPVRDRILSMARANDIPAEDVYWYDESKRTTRVSANVSGTLGTMRISLNDNLLNHTSPEEIEVVMAHEMGHYLMHRPKLEIYFSLIVIVGFAFVKWGADRALARWGNRWGVRSIGDTAGLPLLVALFSIYSFVITPVQYGVVRDSEIEADIFAINVARQPDGMARAAVRLSSYRKINPSPLEEALLNHHPSGRSRIHRAMQWKSEHLEEERSRGR